MSSGNDVKMCDPELCAWMGGVRSCPRDCVSQSLILCHQKKMQQISHVVYHPESQEMPCDQNEHVSSLSRVPARPRLGGEHKHEIPLSCNFLQHLVLDIHRQEMREVPFHPRDMWDESPRLPWNHSCVFICRRCRIPVTSLPPAHVCFSCSPSHVRDVSLGLQWNDSHIPITRICGI